MVGNIWGYSGPDTLSASLCDMKARGDRAKARKV
jgi:hypothetical protein